MFDLESCGDHSPIWGPLVDAVLRLVRRFCCHRVKELKVSF
ncbi:hypothetical protein HanIR_Chr16g0799301 [Helianthus annuus]|nr:hypothetical protein HanIR_Chr16g0799301 [Helianthus annuus]